MISSSSFSTVGDIAHFYALQNTWTAPLIHIVSQKAKIIYVPHVQIFKRPVETLVQKILGLTPRKKIMWVQIYFAL
jgi:hypothetical protein